MKLKTCILILYIFFVLVFPSVNMKSSSATIITGECSSSPIAAAPSEKPNATPSPLPSLGPGIMKPVQPEYLDVVLYNPFSGFAPSAESNPDLVDNLLFFEYISWHDIEPVEGSIDIQHIVTLLHLDAIMKKNAKVIFRVVLDYPKSRDHIDIPDWVYDAIEGDGIHYDTEFGKGFSPNYENKELIVLHRNMIKRLSESLSSYDVFALVELGSIGHWGEWHVHSDVNKKMQFPNALTYNQYIQPYIDYFPDTFLSIRRPMVLPKKEGFALFNDSIGNKEQTYDFYLDWIQNGYKWWLNDEELPAMPDYWKNAPSGGESIIGWKTLLSDDNFESTVDEVKDLHLSYWKSSTEFLEDEKLHTRFESLQKLIGYRFVIQNVAISEKNKIRTLTARMKNTGSAPFYLSWPFAVSLVDEENHVIFEKVTQITPTSIMPGASANIDLPCDFPSTIGAGHYRICLSIVDPKTGLSSIKFPHESIEGQNRYVIGTFTK